MTYDEMIEVIQAARDGHEIEESSFGASDWEPLRGEFDFCRYEYRIVKPKEKTLHPAFGAGSIVRNSVDKDADYVVSMMDAKRGVSRIYDLILTVPEIIDRLEFKHEGKWISCGVDA